MLHTLCYKHHKQAHRIAADNEWKQSSAASFLIINQSNLRNYNLISLSLSGLPVDYVLSQSEGNAESGREVLGPQEKKN